MSHRFESIDEHLVSMMRLILALSALLIIYIDPSEPDRYVNITYGALVLYSIYSAVLYLLSARHGTSQRRTYMYWVDVGWYLVLISLSSGTNSIFFFFFFFIILAASFRSGYLTGLSITLVSATLFTIIGYLTAHAPTGIELNRFLLRPIYLLVIGYLMSYWGGAEIVLKRRLALLNEVSKLSNPRFGVDQTVGAFLARLRSYYDAEACVLITATAVPSEYLLRRSSREDTGRAVRAESVGSEAEPLFGLRPSESAIAYMVAPVKWWSRTSPCAAYDPTTGEQTEADRERCEAVADLLDAGSFISVPLRRMDKVTGRLFLTSKGRGFNHSDADFLRQLLEHIIPIIDNIQLVDRLASEASEQERQKISRDIHDSAIQPYIGLKFGLDALSRKVAPDDPLKGEIKELLGVTNEVIRDLRRYVGGLRGGRDERHEDGLVAALSRQAAKFSEFYGVQVDVRVQTELNVNDRLAAEIFQLVSEGLSNIRRHTESNHAIISLERVDTLVTLSIENENRNGQQFRPFTPRSIAERVAALGGEATVRQNQDGNTVVYAVIPV